MSGTKSGGESARQSQIDKLGIEGYKAHVKRIASMGGSVKNPNKGFGSKSHEQASDAGKLGVIARRKLREGNLSGSVKVDDNYYTLDGSYESQGIKLRREQ